MEERASTPLSAPVFRLLAVVLMVGAALAQLGPLVHERPNGDAWFLFGTDTVSHDLPVLWWLWEEARRTGELPLWMPPLRGGLPTLGAFLWAPFSPSAWLFGLLPLPLAHRLQFVFALAVAGLGGAWTARVLGMQRNTALLVGVAMCLGGHVVTLVHAGHLQKVLALAWLPWFAGGACKALAPGACGRGTLVGVAVASGALGLAFLSGHPQIAYTMMLLLAARVAWTAKAHRAQRTLGRRLGAPAVAIVALGLSLGAVQLLPGSEMSRESNRAGGVDFGEAVATSYPPAELPEFFLPRFRGDSSAAGFNVYFGAWGERLVSDYAGAGVFLLALMALFMAGRQREAGFWWSVTIFFVLVGVGRHTPFYRALYDWLPGMSSFRSPGTFFAAVWLALPVLAGLGLEAIRTSSTPRAVATFSTSMAGLALVTIASSGPMATLLVGEAESQPLAEALQRSAVVVLVTCFGLTTWLAAPNPLRLQQATLAMLTLLFAADLALANRAFLRAERWSDYEAYMAPTSLDVWARGFPGPTRVYEPGREASLRPLFVGRDALLGYHPVYFAEQDRLLEETGVGTSDWRAAFGVPFIAVGSDPGELPEGLEVEARFADGTHVIRDRNVDGPIRITGDPNATWHWVERFANRHTMQIEGETASSIVRHENAMRGWRLRVNEGAWEEWPEVSLTTTTPLPSGGPWTVEWEYRPAAFRVGLFLTLLTLALLGALLPGSLFPGRRRGAPAS